MIPTEIVPQLHSLISSGQDQQNTRILKCLDCMYQADYAGLSLHPFNVRLNEEDLQQVLDDLTFQVRWGILLNEQMTLLTAEELEAVGPLKTPFTPERVAQYMTTIKNQMDKRSIFDKLKKKGNLSKASRTMQTRCAELQNTDSGLTCGTKERAHMLRYVPSGIFRMGASESDLTAFQNEKPQYSAVVSHPFWMGKIPVSQQLYESVMGHNPSRYHSPKCPVDNVKWTSAIVFCNRLSRMEGLTPCYQLDEGLEKKMISENKPDSELIKTFLEADPLQNANGYRLPSEIEWEYAAKANRDLRYSGSDSLNKVAWYHDNSAQQSHPSGQKNPNDFGLYDMTGNVWEWCWNSWDGGRYDAEQNGVVFSRLNQDSGRKRICRGGSWYDSPRACRVVYRQASELTVQDPGQGFRIVRAIIL